MWFNGLFLNGGTVALRLRCWAGMTWMGQLDGREVDGDGWSSGMNMVVRLLNGSKVDDMDGVLLDWREVDGMNGGDTMEIPDKAGEYGG